MNHIARCLTSGRAWVTSSFRAVSSSSVKASEAATEEAAVQPDAIDDAIDNLDAVTASPSAFRQPYSGTALKSLKLDEYPFYVEREWWKKGKRMTFWATWRQLRDVNRRECIQEHGADRMRLKALKENTVLPQAIRDEAAETLHNMPKYSRPRLVLNMCMFTGRQRGKIKPYRVNRHIFRKLADHSQLSGVQRAMW